jgi:UTP:GlnB (protein PII) uridylyltransferase
VLNEILLQHFEELFCTRENGALCVSIDVSVPSMAFLELARADVFSRQPFAIMKRSPLLQQDHRLRGIRASTIRHIQPVSL